MKRIIISTLFILMFYCSLFGQTSKKESTAVIKSTVQKETSLTKHNQLILWTSGDRETALKMVFMYAFNCKKYSWMDTVRLIIWGPSQKLLVEDKDLQKQFNFLKDEGIQLYACKGCADLYGIADKLTNLGVKVIYVGKMLADLQKEGWYILSI